MTDRSDRGSIVELLNPDSHGFGRVFGFGVPNLEGTAKLLVEKRGR